MKKNVLLFLCFCVAVGLLEVNLPRQVANSAVLSKKTAIQPALLPIVTSASINSVANTVFEQSGQDSHILPGTEPVVSKLATEDVAKVPTEDEKGRAEKEKYRVLRELREWAAKDAEGALAAAMKLPEGNDRNQALAAVCFGLAQTDPADAVKMAKNLRLDEQPVAVMENLMQQWAATDLSSALEWANSLPASGQRDGLTTRIAYIMSQHDPANAANLVINQIASGPAQDEAIMTVLNQWANQNLVAATAWAKGFPAGPLQERAVNELEGIANRQQALARQR